MVQTRIISSIPALIVENNTKNLVITDLHIGFEGSLNQNKIYLGKNTSTLETINEILKILDSEKPDSLILLGDIKSTIKSISKNEWQDVPMFFEEMKNKANTFLIPGNHDANIEKLVPEGITLISSTGMVLDDVLFTHGHTMPSENFAHVNKIIMGHVHPVFFDEGSVLNGQRVWVSLKTQKQNIFPSKLGELEITIVPSFNKYFYATHKRQYKKSISPIIERVKKNSSARIVTLNGTVIGNETIIDKVL